MGALVDRINSQIADLDAQLSQENARHAITVAAIASHKAALEETLPLVTDRLESAVASLQKLGFLRSL
jgi:hypothetical protein